MSLELEVINDGKEVIASVRLEEPVVVGRRRYVNEPMFHLISQDAGQPQRLVVATERQTTLSKDQAELTPLGRDRVRLRNVSESGQPLMVRAFPSVRLESGQEREFAIDPPLVVGLGESSVSVRVSVADESLAPVSTDQGGPRHALGDAAIIGELARTLDDFDRNFSALQQAATKDDLFHTAARLVRELLKMDRGLVVLRESDRWVCAASDPPALQPSFSTRAVGRVLQYRKSFFARPDEYDRTKSMAFVEVAAVAPILNARNDVIGALYGERRPGPDDKRRQPGELEAVLLQVLARSVATNLERLRAKEEEELLRLAQYMSPEQARALIERPELARGRELPVTVLFCDVRNFTRITTRAPNVESALEWAGKVLEMLTDCVRKHSGTLIDYTGDGLFALWGAPIESRDKNHADQACEAALEMLARLKPLSAEYLPRITFETDLRLGLNSGRARVGNIGTKTSPKFGAHGTTVNVGARIESAAKAFHCRVMLSASTEQQLRDSHPIRKLGRLEVVGQENNPFDVYELVGPDTPDRDEWKKVYEWALAAFASGKVDRAREACYVLGEWRRKADWDGPALVLLSRMINALVAGDLDEETWVTRLKQK